MSGPDGILSIKGLHKLDGVKPFDGDLASPANWLLGYWRGKRRDGLLPARKDIDPVDIRRDVLPDMYLMDVVPAKPRRRFRYRLVGTHMVDLSGTDPTGRFVDEFIDPARVAEMHDWEDRVVDEPEAWVYSAPLAFKHRDFKWAWRLSLPLAADGKTVDMLLLHFTLGARPPEPSTRTS
ncbi:MAG: PAS domain-containing protein [Tagaea sp.]|nr:PAS domain-containing protein [Tagaea sp.]